MDAPNAYSSEEIRFLKRNENSFTTLKPLILPPMCIKTFFHAWPSTIYPRSYRSFFSISYLLYDREWNKYTCWRFPRATRRNEIEKSGGTGRIGTFRVSSHRQGADRGEIARAIMISEKIVVFGRSEFSDALSLCPSVSNFAK